ncbi:ribosome-associated translation inhibitor RaiA [Candidatus Parcubacteria bacterium]|nr:ribosome-associated translation inhibitor RaiA [Candidatus Parcubacteria bacterium]
MIKSINISGVHKKLNNDIESYVQRKIGALDRFIPKNARESTHAEVKIKQSKAKDKKQYECEVILRLPKTQITVHKKGLTIPEAIDLVEENLKIQLKKYKEKHAGPRLHRRLINRLQGK